MREGDVADVRGRDRSMTGSGSIKSARDAEPDRIARAAFLSDLALFRGLSAPTLDAIASVARPMRWPAGTLIFQRGDDSTMLICIERGHIRISLQSAEGREFTLQHLRAGAILGEVGLLDASPRTADATAVSFTTASVIDRRDFSELMAARPELAQAAIRHLCALVRYTTDHIETIALYSLDIRVARFLLSAVRNAGRDAGNEAALDLDLSQSDIADLIGSSRPKVNRALVALEAVGTIRRDGRIIRCDIERLERAAGQDWR